MFQQSRLNLAWMSSFGMYMLPLLTSSAMAWSNFAFLSVFFGSRRLVNVFIEVLSEGDLHLAGPVLVQKHLARDRSLRLRLELVMSVISLEYPRSEFVHSQSMCVVHTPQRQHESHAASFVVRGVGVRSHSVRELCGFVKGCRRVLKIEGVGSEVGKAMPRSSSNKQVREMRGRVYSFPSWLLSLAHLPGSPCAHRQCRPLP